MAPNVILQGCDLEKSRSSVNANKFSIRTPPPTISTQVRFYQNLIVSFSVTVEKSLTERWQGKTIEYGRNNLLDVDIP